MRQLRLTTSKKMVKFNEVRVSCNGQVFYAQLKIGAQEILIVPYDENTDIICFNDSRLNGCTNLQTPSPPNVFGIQLNPKNKAKHSVQIFFKKEKDADKSASAISTFTTYLS
jgi:hypothetical protein